MVAHIRKQEELEKNIRKVGAILRSPGVYTKEVDVTYLNLKEEKIRLRKYLRRGKISKILQKDYKLKDM